MKSVKELLSSLTLEEKVALLQGHNFMCTYPIPRLGIPSIRFSDGPHGLRAQPDDGDNGVSYSLPATCFPTASCSANTFRPDLLRKMGQAMAEEAKHYDVSVILGPGVNIKRNPLCGRNFEYFSEDPFLAGRMGANEVMGIQQEGVGTSLKHFAGNNSENYRFMSNSVIDTRALREIYLKQFEYIVKTSKPETLMAAYPKINGIHCSENEWLTKTVLREEWGFDGLVMSDWGTNHDRVLGVKAGMDLEMPGDNPISRKWLYDAINDKSLSMEDLDRAVSNVLTLVAKHENQEHLSEVDWERHHQLAKEIALEGAVLLKNDGALPLRDDEELLVIGDLFEKARYQGAGSSMINPHLKTTVKDAFDANKVKYTYTQGYKENESDVNASLEDEAVKACEKFDKILLFVGLTDSFECEGIDRNNLSIPNNQLSLIDRLVKLNKKIVVVLFGGSVMELPFFEDVNSVLDMFLSGQNVGGAAYDLLFGHANPSGRLSETWPLAYADVPFGDEYSKERQDVYKESIYVGYRYYISKNKEVRFPFGYGLSYTTFEYSNLKVSCKDHHVSVSVDVTNTGDVSGAEVVQVYVSSPRDNVHKPIRELKGFDKVSLDPHESKTVDILIDKEDLRFWDIKQNRFVLENGEYEIEIGHNSRDIALREKIALEGEKVEKAQQKAYESLDFEGMSYEEYGKYWGLEVPPLRKTRPYTLESRLSDLKESFMGKILYNAMQSVAKKEEKKAKKMPLGQERDNKIKGARFLKVILDANSIVSLSASSSGGFPYNLAQGFVEIANGHLIKGIKCMTKKIKAPELPSAIKEEE